MALWSQSGSQVAVMEPDIAEILLTEEQIAQRVRQLAHQISADFAGQPFLVLGVLTGAVFFVTDLVRHIRIPLRLEFIRASSYGSGTTSTGEVNLDFPLEINLRPFQVLVVEDIVDTGRTVAILKSCIEVHKPRGIRICSLLDKPSRREVDVLLDYVGFQIPNSFVVGYGLDLNHCYRQLPYVARLGSGVSAGARADV